MRNVSIAELKAFIAISERASFAKAAVHLGLSRSALSETIRGLEEKLGVRLLNRTTRSVAVTDVGERLRANLHPVLDALDGALESINEFREKPAGHLRLSVPRPAAKVVIEPILAQFLACHPLITLEIVTDSALTDIVRDRFDAGIRPGHRLEQDMIAVRVGEDARPTVVASPHYLALHGQPQTPADLQAHNCIRRRYASGALAPWAFEQSDKSLEVQVEGSLIVSDGDLALRAALDGVGIARLPLVSVEKPIAERALVPLLEDWRPRSVGFYLYYPSRRQVPAALQALTAFLRERLCDDDDQSYFDRRTRRSAFDVDRITPIGRVDATPSGQRGGRRNSASEAAEG